MMNVSRRVIALIAMVSTAGCAGGDSGNARAPLIDTLAGGIPRVRGPAEGMWTPETQWHLEEIMRIGRMDGDTPDVFGQIWALTIDPLGRIYVLDRQAKDVRVFDSTGRHVRTLGREGGGPGEFAEPFGFAWDASAHLWVVDVGNSRYSVFDTTDSHIREYTRKVGGYSWPWPGRFDQSGLLYEASFVAGTRPLIAFAPEQDLVAVDTFPNALAGQPPETGSWELTDARGLRSFFGIPFGRSNLWALDFQGRIWMGNSAAYSLTLRSLQGDTTLVIERDIPPVPVSNDERSRAIESLGERAHDPRIDLSRIPETKPFFQRLLPDDLGNLWVLREGQNKNWFFDIFDSAGAFLGALELPVQPDLFPPPHIGREMVAVSTRDSLGVQFVVAYRIVR